MPPTTRVHPRRALLGLLVLLSPPVCSAGIDEWVRQIAESDFSFNRAQTNVPFAPLAWVEAEHFGVTRFEAPGDVPTNASFRQTTVSEGAVLPIPVSRRDLVVTGEWLSYAQFDLQGQPAGDFHVVSLAVPFGWVRQQSAQWQLAAFVAPLGHHASGEGSYCEYLGGFFARYTRSAQLSWLFGVYADVSSAEHFYTPYLGATYIVNPRWTVSAVLPWPAVLYAPTGKLLFRLGVTPSGTAWSVDQGGHHPRIDFSAWNLGVSGEYDLWRNMWVRLEAGWSGFRGFTFVGSEWTGPNSSLGVTPFVSLGFAYRPPQTGPAAPGP